MQVKWLNVLLGAVLSLALMSGCGASTDEEGQQGAEDGDTAVEEEAPEEGGAAQYDEAAAQEAYAGSCAACHGGNLEGSAGPSLEQVGTKYSEEEILDIINNGIGSMPPQGDAVDEEAKEDLAAWLADQK